MEYMAGALLVGSGATALMDAWILARKRWLGVRPMDYALVGRWLGHLARGRFRHDAIAASAAVPHERLVGWSAHYATGVLFAAVLLAIWGGDWLRSPSLGPALIVGVGSVLAPFLVMQPGMGAGIAASRTPRPAAARVQTLVTHAVFGLGLYVAGALLNVAGII